MSKEEVEEIIQDAIRNDDFIKVAYNDLQASKVLWTTNPKKDVCNTIFHLQQSSEKLAKVFLVLFHDFFKKALVATGQADISDEEIEKCIKTHSAAKILSLLSRYHDKVFETLKTENLDVAGPIFDSAGVTKIDLEEGSEAGKELNKNIVKIATASEEILLKLVKNAKIW